MISNENSLSKVIEFIDASNSENIVISHLIHRDIGGCDKVCGGCCKRVTLDYLRESDRWRRLVMLHPDVMGDFKLIKIGGEDFYSNSQNSNTTGFCQYINMNTGLCTIHDARPLLCQSTPLKFKSNPTRNRVLLTSETYGRKHAFKRVDGGKGAKCEMLPATERRVKEDIEFLEELKEIGDIFKLPTQNLGEIISILKVREIGSESITLKF